MLFKKNQDRSHEKKNISAVIDMLLQAHGQGINVHPIPTLALCGI